MMSNMNRPVTVRGLLIIAGVIVVLLAALGGCVAFISSIDFSH
jgi:hypothetical protein